MKLKYLENVDIMYNNLVNEIVKKSKIGLVELLDCSDEFIERKLKNCWE